MRLSQKETAITSLTNQLEQIEKNKPTSDKKNWLKDQLIASLEAKLDKLASQNALELANQLAEKDKEVVSLTNQLDKLALEKMPRSSQNLLQSKRTRWNQNQLALQAKESELSLASVRSDYEAQLKAANEQVEFYKISKRSNLPKQSERV